MKQNTMISLRDREVEGETDLFTKNCINLPGLVLLYIKNKFLSRFFENWDEGNQVDISNDFYNPFEEIYLFCFFSSTVKGFFMVCFY